MPESAIDVIRRYQNEPNPEGERWTVLPPVPEEKIAAAEAKWAKRGLVYPQKYKELQRVTAGLSHDSNESDPIDFAVPDPDGDSEILPQSIQILHDGTGNYWEIVTAIDPNRLGPIFFVCHDPAVIVYQAYDLAAFLDILLFNKEMVSTDHQIWAAGASGGEVQGEWIVFDLSKEVVGAGAPLCLYYDDFEGLERVGNSLVFRIKKRDRNWWQRFRDKWR